MHSLRSPLVLLTLVLALTGCQSAYFSALEKVGIHKRDIMVDRVGAAKEAQEDAQQEFASALDQFQSLFGKEESDLQDQYDRLNAAFEDSEGAAEAVTSKIEAVESVSEALFDEWESELAHYTSQRLKQSSEQKMKDTQAQYKRLIRAMRAAEKRMDPVLNAFRDQVLYLKHNLNSRAISGLKSELTAVESDVARLIKEMQVSINQAQTFIKKLDNS